MATQLTTKLKAGHKVKSIKTGIVGTVTAVRETEKGIWLDINFGDKKKPQMRSARPSQVEKV